MDPCRYAANIDPNPACLERSEVEETGFPPQIGGPHPVCQLSITQLLIVERPSRWLAVPQDLEEGSSVAEGSSAMEGSSVLEEEPATEEESTAEEEPTAKEEPTVEEEHASEDKGEEATKAEDIACKLNFQSTFGQSVFENTFTHYFHHFYLQIQGSTMISCSIQSLFLHQIKVLSRLLASMN